MPSTGSRWSSSSQNRQPRSSRTGSTTASEIASSRPSKRRTITDLCAQGQARETTRRYRPGSTGQRPWSSGPSPGALAESAVIRSVNRLPWRFHCPPSPASRANCPDARVSGPRSVSGRLVPVVFPPVVFPPVVALMLPTVRLATCTGQRRLVQHPGQQRQQPPGDGQLREPVERHPGRRGGAATGVEHLRPANLLHVRAVDDPDAVEV